MSTVEKPASAREALRVVVTGELAAAESLLDALERRGEIAVVAWSPDVRGAAEALTGDVGAVLHVTDGHGYPSDGDDFVMPVLRAEMAAIREHTRAPVVLLSSEPSTELVEEALESGVADILVLPQTSETLAFALRKAGQAGRAPAPAADGEPSRGTVVTVFSPKGGTGKTVMATNLGAALAVDAGLRVLLVDLDLQFGDAAIMLGLHAEKTLRDLVLAPGELDTEKLAGYVTRHETGLHVLSAPLRPEDAELVSEEKVVALLEVAREAYDVVIVDTSPFFYGPMLALLEPTDRLLLLCGLDVPTLKNVRVSIQTLDLLHFPRERMSILLNRVSGKVGMTTAEVESALGIEVRFELPNDPTVGLAVNRGVPAVLADKKSPFAQAVGEIVQALAPATPVAPRRRFRLPGRKS
jgi:pilus assembly protein CpaE